MTATIASNRPLEAVLDWLTYVNQYTGCTVAQVATSRSGDDLLTVVGTLRGTQAWGGLRRPVVWPPSKASSATLAPAW